MANIKNIIDKETKMTNINMIEGKVVAPEGMTVGIVASRFNEVISHIWLLRAGIIKKLVSGVYS